MMDYNSDSKLFLVKRVNIPNHILEANAKKLSQMAPTGSSASVLSGKSDKSEVPSSGNAGKLEDEEEKSSPDEGDPSSGSEEEALPASDGEQKASQPQVTQPAVSPY